MSKNKKSILRHEIPFGEGIHVSLNEFKGESD